MSVRFLVFLALYSVTFNVLALSGTPSLVAEYRFDEASFTGSPGDLTDSSGNNLNGQTLNGLGNDGDSPAFGDISQGTCRYGEFNGSTQYAEVADNNLLDLNPS